MSSFPDLSVADFPQFFKELNDRPPFQWQIRLAERACRGDWPRYLKLPTASGKTCCLDIAVFALAFQAARRYRQHQPIVAPRRVFFVVDRRIVVNEAFRRASRLKERLQQALDQPGNSAHSVAWWLRRLAGQETAPPLDCFELRGGIYRDDAWVRSTLQPTLVTCTVDQIGSRILFRGYGVSDRNLPIHAALTANDALILLDEAHCSVPFGETMASIARYRDAGLQSDQSARWSRQPLQTPFQFLEMTATPPPGLSDAEVFGLEELDYVRDSALQQRHSCPKPIQLIESSAKGARQYSLLARDLVRQAVELSERSSGGERCLRIAVVANRVACAREAYQLLRDTHPGRVELMIGRMRPIDRDRLTATLQERFQSESASVMTDPHFVVTTQCLEVGADLDFDGMVSQCASLDALRQRFGRLNRLGLCATARGVIVMAEGDKAPRKPDPIYGDALPETWKWLSQQARDGVMDFGVRHLDQVISKSQAEDPESLRRLSIEPVHAPVLMPAHLDLLCQTAPRPALEPEIAAFLHGPQRGVPEIRVCWRADLPVRPITLSPDLRERWLEECQQTLAICPPSSPECLAVPLTHFQAWLRGEGSLADDTGDLLGEHVDDDSEAPTKTKHLGKPTRYGLVWEAAGCRLASAQSDEREVIRPNSVIVLPVTAGGWSAFGHLPEAPPEPQAGQEGELTESQLQQLACIDEGTAAYELTRRRTILRVHRRLITSPADAAVLNDLLEMANGEVDWNASALASPVDDDTATLAASHPEEEISVGRSEILRAARLRLAAVKLASGITMIRYPNGVAIIGPHLVLHRDLPRASFDDEYDEHNVDADRRISLDEHLKDVAAETARVVHQLDLPDAMRRTLIAAAERHDLGKADLRFQALLLNSSLDVAAMQPRIWAKSSTGNVASANLKEARSADSLPRGFRHEMLSLQLAELIDDSLDDVHRDAMRHLIAAHHGHARPLAPVVLDHSPPEVAFSVNKGFATGRIELSLTTAKRRQRPAHQLDSGIAERFWRLNERFGWWGLAWLESTLRLSDWVASSQPLRIDWELQLHPAPARALLAASARYECVCRGLNGSNPLGFLAAVGLFRHVARHLDSSTRMSWSVVGGNWIPTLIGTHPTLSDEMQFADWLIESLPVDPGQHGLTFLNELPDERLALIRPSEYSTAAWEASLQDRDRADWLSCNGSDLCEAGNNNQLQTARRDYFPESAAAIMRTTKKEHLVRTLFEAWDYADPIQKVSLHLEPREDRRHAYQWHKPVGDPTRVLRGGMIGANRLAMEAWPLFQSISVRGELQTVGFRGTRPMRGITWTWPIWQVPLSLFELTPLLNLKELQADPGANPGSESSSEALRARGVSCAFRLRRILVEKTPNFTLPVALFSGFPGVALVGNEK